jgi:hypothetical protein
MDVAIIKPDIETAKAQIKKAERFIKLVNGRKLQFTNQDYARIQTAVEALVNGNTVDGKTLQQVIDDGTYTHLQFTEYLKKIAKQRAGRRKHQTRRNKKQRKQRKYRTRKH